MLKAILCVVLVLVIGRLFSGAIISGSVMLLHALLTLPIIPFLLIILGIFLILGIFKSFF